MISLKTDFLKISVESIIQPPDISAPFYHDFSPQHAPHPFIFSHGLLNHFPLQSVVPPDPRPAIPTNPSHILRYPAYGWPMAPSLRTHQYQKTPDFPAHLLGPVLSLHTAGNTYLHSDSGSQYHARQHDPVFNDWHGPSIPSPHAVEGNLSQWGNSKFFTPIRRIGN
jgi:hypothetical protein